MSDYEDIETKIKTFTLFNDDTGQSYQIPILSTTTSCICFFQVTGL